MNIIKFKSILLILVTTVLFIGCNNIIKTGEQNATSQKAITETPVMAKSLKIQDIPMDAEKYKSFIKNTLKLGMTKDQVIELFGSMYNDVTNTSPDSDEYGRYFWRYDLLAEEGYSYNNTLDGLDIEGLSVGC